MNEWLATIAGIDMRLALAAFLTFLDAWCIMLLWRSPAERREKWLWVLVIVLCPLIGLLFWYVLGPKPDMLKRDGG